MTYLERCQTIAGLLDAFPPETIEAAYLTGQTARSEEGDRDNLLVIIRDEEKFATDLCSQSRPDSIRLPDHLTLAIMTIHELEELETAFPAQFRLIHNHEAILLRGSDVRKSLQTKSGYPLLDDLWRCLLIQAARLYWQLSMRLSGAHGQTSALEYEAEAVQLLRCVVSFHYGGYISHRHDVLELSKALLGPDVAAIASVHTPPEVVYRRLSGLLDSLQPPALSYSCLGSDPQVAGVTEAAAVLKDIHSVLRNLACPAVALTPWRASWAEALPTSVKVIFVTADQDDSLTGLLDQCRGALTVADLMVMPESLFRPLFEFAIPSAAVSLRHSFPENVMAGALHPTADALKWEAVRETAWYQATRRVPLLMAGGGHATLSPADASVSMQAAADYLNRQLVHLSPLTVAARGAATGKARK